MKQLTRSERQSFLEFAPDYFRYVAATTTTVQQQQPEPGEGEGEAEDQAGSCLTKILGVFQVQRAAVVWLVFVV